MELYPLWWQWESVLLEACSADAGAIDFASGALERLMGSTSPHPAL